jgi:hypothetical protein
LLALALAVIPAANAFAAKTATVTVTATGGHLSIAISGGTDGNGAVPFGVVIESDNVSTATDNITLTNNGTVAADITIQGASSTGAGTNWTLADDGVPGGDIYGLEFSRNAAPAWTVIKRTAAVTYLNNLAAAGTDKFGLLLSTPTTITDTTNVRTMVVTLTAARH